MPASAFVGRALELARLRERVVEAPAGPRLAVVVGEGGVGKTRLVDELVGSVGVGPDAAGVRVVRGRADEHDPVPFGLWVGPLRQLDLPRPGSDPSVPASEQRWDVVDLLRGAIGGRRTLLALDDLHWADDESLWVLDRLVDDLSATETTVVATTRPGTEVRAPRWHGIYRRAEVVALVGLDAAEVADLVGHLGGDLDPHLLWERTGGNPFLVREQVVSRSGGVVPTAAGALLGAALERAGEEVAAVLSVLAVAGAGTPVDVVADAAGVSPVAVEGALARAREADLVRDDEGALRFRHDLLSEAAADRLGSDERGDVHLALAGAWRRRAGSRPDAEAEAGRHLVLALPSGDVGEAAAAVLAAAEGLCATGDVVRAAHLLDKARAALDDHPAAPADLVARVALAAAEVAWDVDDMDSATTSAEIALARAEAAGDPVLVAGAEVASLRHHNPFVPDAVRVDRLAAVDQALPPEVDDTDPALRIALRGRRAILAMSLPERIEEAIALGDDVVRRARAVGDPEALVGALRDRFFVLLGPDDMESKAAAAEEVLDAARRAGRPELGLLGLEWRFAARMADADLAGAVAALTRLESLAALMPSPSWRYTAAIRRQSLLLLVGDYDGALALATSTTALGRGLVDEGEVVGLDIGMRGSAGLLYGRRDHGGRPSLEAMAGAMGDAPVLFIQAHLAAGEVAIGDSQAARRRMAPWVGRLGDALRGPEGLGTVAVLAIVAEALRWREVAGELIDLLQPYAGRVATVNGVGVVSTIDQHLAGLSLLDGDVDAAAEHVASAVALARRFGAPPIEARSLALAAVVRHRLGDEAAARSARDAAEALAEPIGLVLDPPDGSGAWGIRSDDQPRPSSRAASAVEAVAPPSDDRPATTADADPGRATLRRRGGLWSVTSPHGGGHVADSLGLRQLARLLSSPGTEVAAVDLVGAEKGREVVVASDLGPALDARAKREYRRRVADLQQEIEEAEDHHDLERAAKHRLELDALLDELRAAVGLGGRDRPQGSGAEKARINVSRNVRRAIAAVTTAVPDLGAHLQVSIRTGHRCSYSPEPAAALAWDVDPG